MNGLATFQCLMNAIFGKYMRMFVLIFMDDILVFSSSMQEHLEHLRPVFQILKDNELFLNFKKCKFAQHQISYLGHIISADGVATGPAKTDGMVHWPIPQNITELRGFLGLTCYYRKFVQNYGIIARPLTNLLHHKHFSWSDSAHTTFDHLMSAMISTPVLAFPDFSKVFTIETDACEAGIGVVLTHQGHPLAYFSKGLSIANQILSTYEKEFLAVLLAVDNWRSYLLRKQLIIKNDHQSLCHLQDQTLSTDL
jgi:hypothetical protein